MNNNQNKRSGADFAVVINCVKNENLKIRFIIQYYHFIQYNELKWDAI
ncbi:MAG TPA: hypothetical protein VF047_05550 [Nitrososphaeraceae archaeon]|jgi:hypothetical protein